VVFTATLSDDPSASFEDSLGGIFVGQIPRSFLYFV